MKDIGLKLDGEIYRIKIVKLQTKLYVRCEEIVDLDNGKFVKSRENEKGAKLPQKKMDSYISARYTSQVMLLKKLIKGK